MKKNITLTFLLLLNLFGCSLLPKKNYENKEIPLQSIEQIATDGSDFLYQQYPAGKTTFKIISNKQFANIFKKKLRQKGFGITEDGDGVALYYILDKMQTSQYRLALITSFWRLDLLYFESENKVARINQIKRLDNE